MTTKWKFFLSSQQAWQDMLEAISRAKVSIELEQFIFHPDEIGTRFLEQCLRRAEAGVRVRVLCDAGGSWPLFRSDWPERFRQVGAELIAFNSLLPGSANNHRWWFFRDHQKLLVIDGQVGYTGGICLKDEMQLWRDTHVSVTGPVVGEMAALFEKMWRRARKQRQKNQFKWTDPDNRLRYVANYPLPRQRQLYWQLVESLRGARREILITTPYFVPDFRLTRILRLAARRGVRVKLLIPERSDHGIVDLAARTFFDPLLRAGVKIFLYPDRMIHSKTIIVDDDWATVGSFNFDFLSAYYNFEANLVATDPTFVAELKDHFLVDCAQSHSVELEAWLRRSWWQQFWELLVYPIRIFL